MSKGGSSPFLRQSFVTGAVCINVVGHGCAAGFPGILLPQLRREGSAIPLTKANESWIAAILGLMLLVGSFVAPPLMSRLGRKIAHLGLTAPALIGWFLTILATNFQNIDLKQKCILFGGRQLIVFLVLMLICRGNNVPSRPRILIGLSIGMMSPLRSVLIGEFTSPKNRGAFLTTIALAQAFGIFFVHLIGSLIDWQQTALICVFFPFISLLMTIYSPESPSWLASKGQYERCRKVFHWLRGDSEDEELEEMIEVRLLMEKAEIQNARKTNVFNDAMTIIKKKEFYKPNILMIHAFCMIHFTGGTTMASYSTVIIGLIAGPTVNVDFWMIALDTMRIIANAGAIYVINKIKRRTMMFATGALSLLSHLAIAGYVYARNMDWLAYDATWIPILLINIQFFAVAVGMVPLPTIIAGEVFPLEYKSIGGFISNCSLSGFMFLALKTFPALTDSIGIDGTYLVYSVIIFYNLIIIFILLPETKGRTLQQIEDAFRGRPLNKQEIEARQSLQVDKIQEYKRKVSARRCSSPQVF